MVGARFETEVKQDEAEFMFVLSGCTGSATAFDRVDPPLIRLVKGMIGELMLDYPSTHSQIVRKIADAFVGDLVAQLGVNERSRGKQLSGKSPGCSLIPGVCPG